MEERTHAHAAGLLANIGLAVAKLIVGVAVGSQVLVADGMNSTGDVLATGIGWLGFTLGRRPADDGHPYGHGAFEAAAGLVIGAVLLLTGVLVSVEGLLALTAGAHQAPGSAAVGVAVVTAIVKEALYRYTIHEAERLHSPALRASARDHRADVGLALTVGAAVLGARWGAPWIDPLAAVLVGLWIVWMSWEPLRTNLGVLLDESPPGVADEVATVAASVEGVIEVVRVRVHTLGPTHSADVEIAVDGGWTVTAAHDVAHAVEDAVVEALGAVTEVRVHVQPAG